MVDGDFVGPCHGLNQGSLALQHFLVAAKGTDKFIVYLDALQYQADSFISNRVQPFRLMRGVDFRCVVVHQIDTRCFGVSYICYIIYMTLRTIINRKRISLHSGNDFSPWSPISRRTSVSTTGVKSQARKNYHVPPHNIPLKKRTSRCMRQKPVTPGNQFSPIPRQAL